MIVSSMFAVFLEVLGSVFLIFAAKEIGFKINDFRGGTGSKASGVSLVNPVGFRALEAL